jgi:hypothetical protein
VSSAVGELSDTSVKHRTVLGYYVARPVPTQAYFIALVRAKHRR